VDAPRDPAVFAALSRRVLEGPHTPADEDAWLRAQGPLSSAFVAYLRAQANRYDFFVFFTYLYAFTVLGLEVVDGRRAALLPTAHDEPPIYLPVFRRVFHAPGTLVFCTAAERDLVNHLFGTEDRLQDVIGAGLDRVAADPAAFRARHGARIGGREVVLYAGRIERAKHCHVLFDHFCRFRRDRPDLPATLVLLGAANMEIPPDPDIVHLGFVGEQEKADAFAAARVVVQPSRYESLSLVALEAWGAGRPVLVNAWCDVLRTQCIRSNAGLWYEDYDDFREALALLLGDRPLGDRLGAAGRAYVEREHAWPMLEERYERLVARAVSAARAGAPPA
jgi:glycosyltransferase involved in cell wall biosynthesis